MLSSIFRSIAKCAGSQKRKFSTRRAMLTFAGERSLAISLVLFTPLRCKANVHVVSTPSLPDRINSQSLGVTSTNERIGSTTAAIM
jgi:hypothetical protein